MILTGGFFLGARSILILTAAACLWCGPEAAAGQAADPAAAVSDAGREALARLEADAIALTEAGRPAEADALLEELLQLELRIYGPEHPLVANTYAYRAGLAEAMGDWALAESRRRRETAIRERLGDPMALAAARHGLGVVLINQARSEEAAPFLTQAHEAYAAALAADDERLITTSLALGRALYDLGEYEEGLAILEPVRLSAEASESAWAPRLAYEAGVVLNATGRAEAAEPLLRTACERWRTPGPDGVIWQGEACLNLGETLIALERPDEAATYLEEALTDVTLAPRRVSEGIEALIRARSGTESPASVERLRQALIAAEQAYGESSLFAAYAANRLALELGRIDPSDEERLALLERAHGVYRAETPESISVAVTAINLTVALSATGRREAAVDFSGDVLAALPDPHLREPEMRRSLRRLALTRANALIALERLDEATAALGELRLQAEADRAGADEMVLIHAAFADAAMRARDWPMLTEHRRLRLEHQRRIDDPHRLAQATAAYGHALIQTGDDPAAYQHLEQALALFGELDDVRESDRLYAMSNMGQAARRLGRLDEAERLHVAVLEARRANPQQTRSIGLALRDLGDLRVDQNRFAEAGELYQEALALHEAAGDEEDASHVLSALGQLWRYMGRMDEAETALRRVVDYVSQRHGPQSPLNASPLRNLAVHLEVTGRRERALDLLLQAQALEAAVLAEDDPSVILTRIRIGRLLTDLGRPEESEPIFADALDKARARLGTSSFLTHEAATQLGFSLIRQGRYAEAVAILRDAESMVSQAFGPDSRQMINVLQILSYALYMDGRYDETIAIMSRVVRLVDTEGARWPATIVDAKSNLGRTYIEAGRAGEALNPLREAAATATRLSREQATAISARADVSRAPFRALVQAAWIVSGDQAD